VTYDEPNHTQSPQTIHRPLETTIDGKRREGETVGAAHCALCDLFLNDGCSKCPVAQKVQRSGCSLTPYAAACDAHCEHGIDSPEFKAAAKVELEFLQSLLPKQRTKKSK
jgi:hypothetical protein